jgi:hypothetical protein
MLKYIKYMILLAFFALTTGCYVRTPSVGISSDYHYHSQPRYRYVDKRVCKWKHGRQHCRIVRVRVIVR